MSIEDVAEHLGVSVRHVRRLVFERRIPYVKWGHLVRFDIDDVNDWLANSRVAVVKDNEMRTNRLAVPESSVWSAPRPSSEAHGSRSRARVTALGGRPLAPPPAWYRAR